METLSKEEFLKHAAVNEELKALFIQTSSEYYEMEDESFLAADEVDFHGKQLLIELDLEKGRIHFISDLKCENTMVDSRDSYKSAKDDLFMKAKLLGFDFLDSLHGSNGEYTWHSLSTPVDKFSLKDLERFVVAWVNFDNKVCWKFTSGIK